MAKSSIGTAFGFVSTITSRIIGGLKLSRAEEAILSLSEDTVKKLTDEFVTNLIAAAIGVAENCYQLVVNYCMGLEEMIQAGKYDWADSDITSKNFPITQHGKVEVAAELIHLNREVSSDEAIAALDRMGYRPETLPELLAFGAKYPEVQREFPIVALGFVSLVYAYRCVACLWSHGGKRKLDLSWFDSRWGADCRFLAVRK